MGLVGTPTGEEVCAFLGVDPTPGADEATEIVTQFAHAYTRGNGFEADGINSDIRAVIMAAAARLIANPEQLDLQVGELRRASFFRGWMLAERTVLDKWRGTSK